MKTIESVRISFENCECFEFTREHVSFIALRDIKSNAIYGNNYLHEYSACDSVSIQLESISNTMKVKLATYEADTQLPFDRILQYLDIASVEVYYSDGSSIDVYVKWKEDGDERDSNIYQTAKLNSRGDMCIVIDEEETAEKLFEID